MTATCTRGWHTGRLCCDCSQCIPRPLCLPWHGPNLRSNPVKLTGHHHWSSSGHTTTAECLRRCCSRCSNSQHLQKQYALKAAVGAGKFARLPARIPEMCGCEYISIALLADNQGVRHRSSAHQKSIHTGRACEMLCKQSATGPSWDPIPRGLGAN